MATERSKDMNSVRGQVEGVAIAKYYKGRCSLTCKVIGEYYCVTFHNGRYSATTHYSTDKAEMNGYIKEAIRDGYKRAF